MINFVCIQRHSRQKAMCLFSFLTGL
jgi:hypothetical protein